MQGLTPNVHMLLLVCAFFAFFAPLSASAQNQVTDFAIQISATVQTNPPQIHHSWIPDPSTTNLSVYRKSRESTDWGEAIPLTNNASSYIDTNVVTGIGYEYRIQKINVGYFAYGYIYSAIEMPLVETRGKLLLLVDQTHATALTNELDRLKRDLVGDGWTVIRHDVDPADSVAVIKSLIQSEYSNDPVNLTSLFLFGNIAVPYSGNFAPDGHNEHKGAWPADPYYVELNGTWTDFLINSSTASDPRNRNVEGDGKFDQAGVGSGVELQMGRVDLSDLPAFTLSEQELLRQYLNKDHAYRHKQFTAEPRGLIDDHLGVAIGEAYAVSAYRNFSAFFGPTNIINGDWLTTLRTQSFQWGFGAGVGNYTGANGVATTAQLAVEDPQVVFSMTFGSFFGDWDVPNNFLRAPLATPTYTLASVWSGRPYWMFHHMAMGETIGSSTRVTLNNRSSLYSANGFIGGTHSALMGDPTLRMHVVAPPTNVTMTVNLSNGMDLAWEASPEPVLGYAVYRSDSIDASFTRLNPGLLQTTSFTDPGPTASTTLYMVKAVTLQTSASGSYFNSSQGQFAERIVTTDPPELLISRAGNQVTLSWHADATGFVLHSKPTLDIALWSSVTNAVTTSNEMNQVTLDAIEELRFFQLELP